MEQEGLLRDLDDEEVVKPRADRAEKVSVEVEDSDVGEILRSVDSLSRLSPDDVEKGIRKVTIKSVARAYFIRFGDEEKKTPVLELIVHDSNGKPWILRFKTSNIRKLKEKLGDNPAEWEGKKLLLFVAGTNKMRYITFDIDV